MAAPAFLFCHVRIFTGRMEISLGSVLVENGIITAVSDQAEMQPPNASTIVLSCSGHTLFPGFIDGHVHAQSVAFEDIQRLLKVHYLRTRSHDEAMEILYPPAGKDSAKTLFLDLMEKSNLTHKGIRRITSCLKFEDTLQFVALPQITKTEDAQASVTSKTSLKKRQTIQSHGGRTDMIEVFKLLVGVKKILEIIVDDLKEPAQSDDCIESILSNRGVEVWNWKKIDICSEVIRCAAPDVTKLHLYWSGKNAVLRGWSEKKGIPQLNNLKQITLHILQKGGSILVALIDDGVDIERDDLLTNNSRMIEGYSFCPQPDNEKRSIPHYISSGGHGTIMASQIHRICPWAELYVLKLHDQWDSERQRRITANSAARAIRQAVKKGVHIISMSWTIVVPPRPLSSDFEDLEAAIGEAQTKGILMFCSASDKGAHQCGTYPSKRIKSIFTIGAATPDGQPNSRVGDIAAVDYLLPGELVEGEQSPDLLDTKVEYFTGSSIATALAAGLAALILYCAQIRMMREEGSEDQHALALEHFNQLKTHDKMRQAFENIGKTNERYLKVWSVFQNQMQDFDSKSAQDKLDMIARLAVTLCTHF
ncbi:subtilisin-like protein [Aspergillus aculeatinus CBS 121060]|uniref:Subtilisin-like protein n=1 Tax=Aspergillus aculeatinus CBS 121060 TaxID=1448322 RepID=A0ACD1GUL6_9EURO|nr:subtilisin-like protein [Aspergillus aculeatinus CBS 121060]RAH64892.1 subtilisin-like protein [Aspergillus aculeatinus CBS 121060]